MKFAGTCYRAHDPRWAMSPVSGDGAAIRGARFNPKGVPALYLSTSIEGAVVEASQGFGHKIHPLTICAYEIDCEDIADLASKKGRQSLAIRLDTMASTWASALADGKRPETWGIYDALHESFAGILVPSFANGAEGVSNLVLWTWSEKAPRSVKVIDPTGRLPKDQRSWE